MRVLIAARLSRLADGQTGLDTQEKEVTRWALARGYTIVDVVADRKSGKSHLWERRNLRPWVTEPEKLAQYDALAALKVDRITRAEDAGVDELKKWARDNHKQILISSADVKFPSEGVEGLLWDAYIRTAHAEWQSIQERFVRMTNAKHASGSWVGSVPWGYCLIDTDGIKEAHPTADGRRWIPQIFAWAIEGKSLREIAMLLEASNVPPLARSGVWGETRLGIMIRNPAYAGLRVRKGRAAMAIEPLVSSAIQDKAILTIETRNKGRRARTPEDKPLLIGLKCGHPDCPGSGQWPMYKINGKYYRCWGVRSKDEHRHGCGAPMVPMETLDNLVLGFTEYWDTTEHVDHVYIAGNDTGVLVEQVRAEMADAMRVAPSERMGELFASYNARILALEAAGSMVPHWEPVRRGITEGQHLQTLDTDGQRQYLSRKTILAWRDAGRRVCVTVDGALARTGGTSAIADA